MTIASACSRRVLARMLRFAIPAGALLLSVATHARAGDEHWSRQFANPKKSTDMGPGTGMSDGTGAPHVSRVKRHGGKLWFGGAWEAGADPRDLGKARLNDRIHFWSYSEQHGWQAIAHTHPQGGQGPDGPVNDFVFLPDGRIVVGGEFSRVDNPGGNRFHGVNGLAVFDPKEPTADKWRPLGTPNYNGTVSAGGSVQALEYDPQSNDLFIGGSFGGILLQSVYSNGMHRYDFDTGTYEPLQPGIGKAGGGKSVDRIVVDASTKPSTVYFGGRFHWGAGDGEDPATKGPASSSARYSTGVLAWQEGTGWRTFPAKKKPMKKEECLQRAADFMFFDGAAIHDMLVDGKDLWIVGAFSEGDGTGQRLRGIARWDAEKDCWTDPTGKGGVGRDVFSIAKAANGKIYFAGAFGGRKTVKETFPGFLDGTPAHLVASFDPASGKWEELGTGLSSAVMPECRLAVEGNDVWVTGDFQYIGSATAPGPKAPKDLESWRVARWNETVDFTKEAPRVAAENAPYEVGGPGAVPASKPQATGNEHWSRELPAPPRAAGGKSQMSGRTGMDTAFGTADVAGVAVIDGTVYLCGSWEAQKGDRWFVWSFHKEKGWQKLAGGKAGGPNGPPEGMTAHDGKLWVHGALSDFSGVAIFDPKAGTWGKLEGTFEGKPVAGNAALGGTGAVNAVAFDPRTGDTYIAGNWAPTLETKQYGKLPAACYRIDKEGGYHPMGFDLACEDPAKPVKGIYSICLDTTKEPTDVYVGGTFNFYGPLPTTNQRMAYNVAKWSHADQDWRPIGKGCRTMLSELDKKTYPEGLPGLPAHTDAYQGFLAAIFPRVRCLAIDKAGNLYAGGSLGIIEADVPKVADRKEAFGLVKYDRAQDRWVAAEKSRGVSRDVVQMTWLSDTELLLSGGFVYDGAFGQLHNVAVLDTAAGELRPLGGGLLRESKEHLISASVFHAVAGDDIWFAGLFDHAGVNAGSLLEAPVESAGIARWNGKQDLDPNRGLAVEPVQPIEAPKGNASKEVTVALAAKCEGEGTIVWYERKSDGSFVQKATAPGYMAKLRVKAGDRDAVVYVAVRRPDGTEGGKLPVRIPVK